MFTHGSKIVPRLLCCSLLGLLLLPGAARAQDQTTSASYAAFYGDGLRAYAEGRYGEAVAQLFRAYAIKPSAHTMGIIVRSYDFMGHCSAAERQLELMLEQHEKAKAPTLQRCASAGTLQLECAPRSTPLIINNVIETQCGAEVRLARGTHIVTAVDLGVSQRVEIAPGEVSTATLKLRPRKWTVGEGEQPAAADQPAAIERLDQDGRYSVIQLPDGLYYIWVLTPQRAGGEGGDPANTPRLLIPRIDTPENFTPRGGDERFKRVR